MPRDIELTWDIGTGAFTFDRDTGNYVKRGETVGLSVTVEENENDATLPAGAIATLKAMGNYLTALVQWSSFVQVGATNVYIAEATVSSADIDTLLGTTQDFVNCVLDIAGDGVDESDTLALPLRNNVTRDNDTAPTLLVSRNDFYVTNGTGLLVNVAAGYLPGSFIAAQSSVAVSNNTTNYVEMNSSGVASVNTSGFTAGYYPLATVVTSGGAITSNTDMRVWINSKSSGSGSVTSVGLSMPSIFSVSGSPVTSSGTLAASLNTQSANQVFAGPTSGSAATPSFRTLVASDLPNTAVTAGSYTLASITVDAQGRITGASSGSVGLTVGTTAISGGTSGRILYDAAGVLGEIAMEQTYLGASFDYFQETMHFIASTDCSTWRRVHRTPITTTLGTIRDPALHYNATTKTFVVAYTKNGFSGGNSWGIGTSTDLLNWTWSSISTGSLASGTPADVWVGDWFVDDDGSDHVLFAARTTASQALGGLYLYETHPTTPGDYSAWSTPVQITGSAITNNLGNSPTIIKVGSTYHLFYDLPSANGIRHATSTSLTSGYNTAGTYPSFTGSTEGPSIVQLYSGTYRLYAEKNYAVSGAGLYYSDSADLVTWGTVTAAVTQGYMGHPHIMQSNSMVVQNKVAAALEGQKDPVWAMTRNGVYAVAIGYPDIHSEAPQGPYAGGLTIFGGASGNSYLNLSTRAANGAALFFDPNSDSPAGNNFYIGRYNGVASLRFNGGTENVDALGAFSVASTFTANAQLILSGRADATIAADQNDWAPTGATTASEIFVDGGVADRNITGLAGGVAGRIVGITNKGATNNIVLKNSSASSTTANRFLFPADVTLPPNTAIELRYDGTASNWRPWGRALANSGVTAGSYTNASVTVDVAGRVTAASSGTAPVTSITGTANQVIVTGTTTPTLSLPQSIGTSSNVSFGSATLTGGLALNTSASITTDQTTATVLNATPTTVNAFGAATSITMGAATGTCSIRNATVTLTNCTALNISGAGTTITGGAGNMTIVAGTGNSRTWKVQTTTSGGTATDALTLDATQAATFSCTTDSSSTSTGAVIVSGGIGVAKKIWAGDVITAKKANTAGLVQILSGASNAYISFYIGTDVRKGEWGVAGAAGQFTSTAAAGDVILKTVATSTFFFDTNDGSGTPILTLKPANGNVGVGTTSPNYKLDVGGSFGVSGVTTLANGTATPAGGSTSARTLMGTTAGFGIYYGSGAPTVSAAKGSLYLRSDGSGTNDRMYVNTDGGTTWTAVTTAA